MSQSDELDKILSSMAFRCAGGITDDGRKEYLPAKQAIITMLQAHGTEARIDELEKLDKTTDVNGVPYITGVVYGVIIERIEYLRKILTREDK